MSNSLRTYPLPSAFGSNLPAWQLARWEGREATNQPIQLRPLTLLVGQHTNHQLHSKQQQQQQQQHYTTRPEERRPRRPGRERAANKQAQDPLVIVGQLLVVWIWMALGVRHQLAEQDHGAPGAHPPQNPWHPQLWTKHFPLHSLSHFSSFGLSC